MLHDMPQNYHPINFCRSCGKDFTSVEGYDLHRVGTFEYTYQQGLTFDPPKEDGRRCRDDDELIGVGLKKLTEGEMNESRKYRSRVGFSVPLWQAASGYTRG